LVNFHFHRRVLGVCYRSGHPTLAANWRAAMAALKPLPASIHMIVCLVGPQLAPKLAVYLNVAGIISRFAIDLQQVFGVCRLSIIYRSGPIPPRLL
jgi:hypothetical protein